MREGNHAKNSSAMVFASKTHLVYLVTKTADIAP